MGWPIPCRQCGSTERQGFRHHADGSVTQTCYEYRCHDVREMSAEEYQRESRRPDNPKVGYTYRQLTKARDARVGLIDEAIEKLRDARALSLAYPPDWTQLSIIIEELEELRARHVEGAA